MKKVLWILGFNFIAFVAGAHLWKISKGGKSLRETLGWRAGEYNPNLVLAYVNGEEIYLSDVEDEVKSYERQVQEGEGLVLNSSLDRSAKNLREHLLQQIIERKVMLGYLKREGLVLPCEVQNQKADRPLDAIRCEQEFIDNYLATHLYKAIEVPEDELLTYYSKNTEEFKQPAKIQFRQIVFATESEAEKARSTITTTNFSQKARELSISPESEDGGLLPPLSKLELPPSLDIVFQLRQGQLHGIIKSTFGFHYVLVEKKTPAQVLSFEQSRDLIYRKILDRKKQEAYDKWFELALSFASVKQSL